MRDTSAAAEARYFDLLRAQPALERLRTAMTLTRAVRQLAEQAIRTAHPQASSDEVRARLADRLYGRAVAERLFPGLLGDG